MAAEKKYLPMTPRLRAQAKALWETGEFANLSALAAHLSVSPASVKYLLKAEDKGVDAEAVAKEVKKAVVSAAAEDAVLVQARARDTREEHYKMANGIAKLTWAEILLAKSDARAFSTIAGNLKALDIAMSVLKKAREERFAVLGLNDQEGADDGTLPELYISELTDEQVKTLRETQEDEDFLEMPAVDSAPEAGVVDTTDDSDIEELS
jgi:hypothetical protein